MDTAETFALLASGDRVEITIPGRSSSSPNEVRTVAVQSRDGRNVYTTSGKVNPGNIGGGAILDYGDALYFQPTMKQPIRRILALRRVAVLAFPG